MRTTVVVSVSIVLGAAGVAVAGSGVSGHVTNADGRPVEGANVLVVAGKGYVASATTGPDGGYAINVRPGTYQVVMVSGGSRLTSQVTIGEGKRATVDARLADAPSEVIELYAQAPPAVVPKPKHYRARKLLAYSDAALEHDVWTKAWLLLDVSKTGRVVRVKFLKRPGADLDDIALRAAFDQTFEPGRDEHGNPIEVWMVWGYEWPAASWLTARGDLLTAKPADVGFPPVPADYGVPCRGSGPMVLDSMLYHGYKDCSVPEPDKADDLPWIDERP